MTAKKLFGIIRAILYMHKKRSLKSIPWFELHMMLKRSTKLAGKAIENLFIKHETLSSTLTCHPNNIHTTFITPIEYKFSPHFHTKRKTNRHYYYSYGTSCSYNQSHRHHEAGTLVTPEKSPLTILGFGGSLNVRELQVTDSPFPENNMEEDALQVDKAAEEFIKNFYQELKQQKKMGSCPLSW
ncbi:uncharacterized protein LOC143606815 [Bidens hawaiensis]|uniref:uncharacterized protein LOC143606815 n=1 Tax=Bidens hawaiensis TaxID=980011 RepID=UPI00404A6121